MRATRSTKAKECQEKKEMYELPEKRTLARQVDLLSIGWARVEGTQTRGKVGPRLPAFNGTRCKVRMKDGTAGPASAPPRCWYSIVISSFESWRDHSRASGSTVKTCTYLGFATRHKGGRNNPGHPMRRWAATAIHPVRSHEASLIEKEYELWKR